MTSNDNGHINNLDENQYELLKKFWISLISAIDNDSSKIIDSTMGNELFYLFGKDNPDMILLRWLRARKWQISSSVQLMMDTLKWRNQWGVQKLLENGENDLIIEECLTSKTYHMGKDRSNRPVTYVHANEHIKGQFPFNLTEKFVVLNMELGRYLIDLPIEEGTVVLDMANVTFKNLDYQHIKFMINAMQNYYPECLGIALIVNPPWGFNTIWNIIRPWLDPIVESKIHFVKNSKELIEYIDPIYIPKRLDGNHLDYQFIPLNKQDQHRLNLFRQDKDGMKKALFYHKDISQNYLDITLKWASTLNQDKDNQHQRIQLTKQLNDAYTQLIPYISTETFYHRTGIIQQPIFDIIFNRISNQDDKTSYF